MRLNQRVARLERRLAPDGACPVCTGQPPQVVIVPYGGEPPPTELCPHCGREPQQIEIISWASYRPSD